MGKKKYALAAGGLVCLALFGALYYLQEERDKPYTLSTFAMGSYIQQTVYGKGGEEAAAQAAQEIGALENRISWRREHSDIALLNASAGNGPVSLDPATESLLETALEVGEKSGGAFDVTIAPVSRLWDFDENPHLPEKEELAAARALVDYRQLALTPQGVSLSEGMAVDLGAAGKGAACDKALAVYQEAGLAGGVAAAGGSVGLYGKKPGGSLWQISVRDPWGGGSVGVLELEEGFVSTSGSYEKTFQQDGITYHHLIDPKTGYPAESGLVSVTVCSGSGALSDCLSTACFVLGEEKSLPLLESFSAQALFIHEDGSITCTPGLEEAFIPYSPGDLGADKP
ncbi:MAG: FAD:protein FMN transferase [Acutalibacter sp.]|nr:FAD:protein FMN transferase [Acutalibacter sp.]MCI8920769.1 FAD:protein FMN transferase [Acutalibacter sp.]